MQIEMLISIAMYMSGMLVIGYWAYKRTTNAAEYMLGGRTLGPFVTALSAGAADMSGWLLMGVPGTMFVTGISGAWIAAGLVIGAYMNYLFLAPRLRVYTERASNAITIPDYLESRFQDTTKILRFVSAAVIFLFFTLYVSAGMVSGGRLFESALGVDYHWGLWTTAGVVVCYTLFGGFLAVSWTDAVQGCIMVIALVLVPVVVLRDVEGVSSSLEFIKQVDPSRLELFKGVTWLGILSFLAWGLGYFGQPHIIVRFMAISSVKELKKARRIGMSWMVFTVIGAMFTGLFGLAYYTKHNLSLSDPETIFIQLSTILFHPLISGFLIAGVLAAIMSTISSQLLVTSSSVTEDFYKTFFHRNAKDKELIIIGRVSVFLVAVIAALLAIHPHDVILRLVGYAWAGFGSSFGPVILLSLFWKRMTHWGALAGMIVGAVTVMVWIQFPFLKSMLYEIIPGFLFSLLAVIIVSLCDKRPPEQVVQCFDEVERAFI